MFDWGNLTLKFGVSAMIFHPHNVPPQFSVSPDGRGPEHLCGVESSCLGGQENCVPCSLGFDATIGWRSCRCGQVTRTQSRHRPCPGAGGGHAGPRAPACFWQPGPKGSRVVPEETATSPGANRLSGGQSGPGRVVPS